VKPVDRALVRRLLEETDLSHRAIAADAQCSDWSVRKIAREIAGGARPMKNARARRKATDEPLTDEDANLAWWAGPLIVILAVGVGVAASLRRPP